MAFFRSDSSLPPAGPENENEGGPGGCGLLALLALLLPPLPPATHRSLLKGEAGRECDTSFRLLSLLCFFDLCFFGALIEVRLLPTTIPLDDDEDVVVVIVEEVPKEVGCMDRLIFIFRIGPLDIEEVEEDDDAGEAGKESILVSWKSVPGPATEDPVETPEVRDPAEAIVHLFRSETQEMDD